jgi:hypothetical protein
MARGGHGLPKVSPGLRHALPFYALWAGHPWKGLVAVSGVARLQGGRPSSTPLDTPRRTPMIPDRRRGDSSEAPEDEKRKTKKTKIYE